MLRTRILTAIVLCAVILGALLQPDPAYFGALLGLMLVAAAWEWSGFLHLPGIGARVAYVLLVLAGCAATRHYLWEPEYFLRLLQFALLWWFVALVWVVRAPARIGRWTAALAGLCVMIPAVATLLRVATEWPQGLRAVLLIVGVAAAMDTGGYFGGRAFGRHKLAPRVSPGKTWEGLYGGLLLVFVLALLLTLWLPYARWPFVGVALLSGAFSVVGDLTESLLKRANGMKDSGHLLPGHGGVLDRIDSITAAAPVMTLSLIWLGAGA
jgi:phosphatidate cytidylyltransferase